MKQAPALLLAAALALFSSAVSARPTCYVDPVSDAYTCYDHVTEVDGIRYADMYTGGPRSVDPTGFQYAMNCRTGAMHLKDRHGASFSGGTRNSTPVSSQLFDWICAEPIKAKKAPKKP